jgi:hypothetical protein
MSGTNPNYLAGGNIYPSRFVAASTTQNNRVVQATTAGSGPQQPVGISQPGTKRAPIPGASQLAAEAGDAIKVYGEGEQCLLEYGATVTAGQWLVPDADGKGVPMAASGNAQTHGAMAMESGSAGELHRVTVKLGKAPATAS